MQDSSPKENPFSVVSFSHGYRSSNKTEAILQHPGVGDYNVLDESPKSGGMKFFQSHRHDPAKAKLFIPGPGAYDLATSGQESPKKSGILKSSFIGSPSRDSSFLMDKKLKGGSSFMELKPGASRLIATDDYSRKKSLNKSGLTSEQNQKFINEFSVPGPGTYNVRETYESPGKKKLGVVIGTAQRDVLGINSAAKEGIPGPLYYSHNFGDIIGTGNQPGSFPKSRRHDDGGERSPGPGEYEQTIQPSPTKGQDKGTFGTYPRKLTVISNKAFPGPANYDDKFDKFGNKSILMSQTKRPSINNKNPGVGDYNIIDGFSALKREAEKKAAFKKMMQTLQSTLGDSPSDFSTSFLSRSKSIDQSLNLNIKSNYVSSVFQEPLQAKPIKDTWVDTMIYNNSSPGPVYSFLNRSIEEGKPGPKFKKQSRLPLNNVEIKAAIPGPGSYIETLLEPVKTDVGGGLPRRRRPSDCLVPLHVRKNPGVGKYETELKKLIQGGTMTKANRGLQPNEELIRR